MVIPRSRNSLTSSKSELCKGKEEDKIREEFHLLLFFSVFVHDRAKCPLSLAPGRAPGC